METQKAKMTNKIEWNQGGKTKASKTLPASDGPPIYFYVLIIKKFYIYPCIHSEVWPLNSLAVCWPNASWSLRFSAAHNLSSAFFLLLQSVGRWVGVGVGVEGGAADGSFTASLRRSVSLRLLWAKVSHHRTGPPSAPPLPGPRGRQRTLSTSTHRWSVWERLPHTFWNDTWGGFWWLWTPWLLERWQKSVGNELDRFKFRS